MRRRLSNLLMAAIILVISCLGAVPAIVSAATTPPKSTGQALEIAPPVVYLNADPGKTIKTQILLRNVSTGSLIVTGTANDFVASGEDGTPKLILDNSEPDPYSLKDWVNPPAELLIAPREIKTMNISIDVPKDASPGGHYGVIRFTATPPELKGTGVSLSASLGALILLTVSGNIKENLSVKEFYTSKVDSNGNEHKSSLFQSSPINFTERIQNSGNVHEQPTGLVTVKDMFGKTIATLGVNQPPKSILPNSIRKFTQPLDKTVIGNRRLFGRYTAKLQLKYGASNTVLTSSLSFWVIPYKAIFGIIIILIALFFGIRYAIRRYNRYIVKRASGQRKK